MLIIEEFCPIIARLASSDNFQLELKLCLLRPVKNLVIASTFTVCQSALGVQLISKHEIMSSVLQLLNQIDLRIKDVNGNLPISGDINKLLRAEFCSLLCSALEILIEISKYLIHTKQFSTFADLMRNFFRANHQELLQSLFNICELRHDSNSPDYSFIYKIVDLLLQLQVTLQYSQSLSAHKKLCTKRRHKKCDLTPLMVHHLYHEHIFGQVCSPHYSSHQTAESADEFPCFISSVYHVLISLIFTCSKRPSEVVDKLICHICGHLSTLISCCWSLKHHFNRLLHFAVNVERSNSIRSSIFNIIEFNIRNQRKYLFNTNNFVVEKCSCAHEEMCENSVELMIGSEKSEGYLTDNANSSTAKWKCRLGLESGLDHCLDANCLIASLSPHYLTLKSDSPSIRQTIFRHMLNLFSYLSTNSKVSLLYHIIFPVIQNPALYSLDVCAFTLRLLIFISNRSGSQSEELNLLAAFTKVDGFVFLKHLIENGHSGDEHSSHVSSDHNRVDQALLGISLLESFVTNELMYLQSINQHAAALFKSSSPNSELPPNVDLQQLSSINLLVNLFMDQFSHFKRISILPTVQGALSISTTSLEGYIDFYQKACFNYCQMEENELIQFNDNLVCFLKMLNTTNNILFAHKIFRLVLTHDSYRFTEKLYLFFQQTFQLVLNEVKLFRLLSFRAQNSVEQTSLLDVNKYASFLSKVIRMIEQILLLLLQLYPFSFGGDTYTISDICSMITYKLDSFTSDENLVKWSMTCPIDPIQDLLKMFVNIAFNSDVVVKSQLKNNWDDLFDLKSYSQGHPRSSSFDSMMSDNDSANDSAEMDNHDTGYQADTEGFLHTRRSLSVKEQCKQSEMNASRLPSPNNCSPSGVLKYVDICKAVILFLSQSLNKPSPLLAEKSQSEMQIKSDLDCTLAILNTMTRYCKENSDNGRILFENDFSSLLINSFGDLLTSSCPGDKSIKFAIFDLFIEICKVKLRTIELKLLIDLFKQENADFDFLLTTMQKILFSRNPDPNQPVSSVHYPVDSSGLRNIAQPDQFWLDSIISNVRANLDVNENDQMCFKAVSCALPFSANQIVNFNCSFSFWIYLDKINPLIDKFKSSSSLFGHSSQRSKSQGSRVSTSESKLKLVKCIHVISLAFNSSSIELWFDYIYNRFVYRVCKENNGKLIYSSENFISNLSNILGRWNFVRVNIEQVSVPKSRSSFVKVNHSTNCSKDDTIKLAYPVNLLEKKAKNCALLLGSTQLNSHFHYKLGNVLLFNQHLQPSSTVFLYSLGPDFAHLHHLKSEHISKENYFSLPKQLVKDSSVDLVSSMYQHISPSLESKLILKHLIVLYRVLHPEIYFTYQSNTNKSSMPFSRFYPQSTSGKKIHSTNDMVELEVKMYGTVQSQEHIGVCKTIADSGGVSLFLFMLCYVFERSDNHAVYHKTLELLLKVYDSHYQHRLLFDTHYIGHQVVLFVLEKSQKSFSAPILRVFAQFSLDSISGHSVILSSAVGVFLQSWKVWCKNRTTMKLFFSKLESLVIPTNAYRNYNLAQLRRVNAFSRLLNMLKDMYINYNDDSSALEVCLDSESLDHVITIFKSIIDSNTDLNLFKSVFNCILILQRTEWLHVNQTRTSFYYLFPSTWLSRMEHSADVSPNFDTAGEEEMNEANFDLADWEIVSEMLDGSAQVDPQNESFSSALQCSSNCDLVTNQLLLLVNRFVDQLSEISLIDVIFEQILCLDFLLVFVNTPSDRIREVALKTYFKFFNLFHKKDGSVMDVRNDSVNGKGIKDRILHLLLLANQLYHYMATEEMVLICLSFLLDLNHKCVSDLFNNQESSAVLTKSLHKVSLENFIPFLAILPKCVPSLGFCHKVLQMLHRILRLLPTEQVCQLQQDFGLAQSLSKLLINLNTQILLTADDLNKYSKEHLNEQVYKILFEMAQNYLKRSGVQYFNCFANLLHYFAIMERKVSSEVSPIFRQAQVSLLQAAIENLLQQQNAYNQGAANRENLDILSEQFVHILSGSDMVQPDFSTDFSVLRDAHNNKQKDRDLAKPKEVLDRLKFAVKKSASFIICRDDIQLSQKEIFFQREVLYHLFVIVDQLENAGSRDSKWKVKTSLFQSSKDFFKGHLTQIVLFLISPFQSLQDRLFSLNLFVEKTKTFEYVKLFIDRSNERFTHLFEAFLVDLIEKGVKDLSIYNLRNYPDDFSPLPQDFLNDSYNSQESLPLEFVLAKFKSQMGLKSIKNASFYKSEIASWYSQIEEHKTEYELSIRKHVNKIFANTMLIFNQVCESASLLNDTILFAQHREKKEYIEHIRKESFATKNVRSNICNLINESVHERAFWHLPQYYPQSWALSPFESKNRIRRKLERNFLDIDKRYVMQPSSKLLSGQSLFSSTLGSNGFFNIPTTEALAPESNELHLLIFTTSVRVILFDEEIEGEILLKNYFIQFFANKDANKHNCLTFSCKRTFFQNFVINFSEIQELTSCRYELQNNAIEIYLNSGLTYLIAFESTAARTEFTKHLTSNREMLPNLVEKINPVTLTQLWRERRISNFEYLTHLNKLSGRTSNDLMQYPVFPFVLADYQSEVLNLKDSDSFRIFSRPIAVQKKEREKHYVDQYNYIKSENERNRTNQEVNSFQFVVTSAPYHYGSHYSNSGIVLHYLVRLPPYTQMFLHYQDKNFDIPDRTFHSIYTTWRLATEDSTNGFKELIPEFFYLPEFLLNREHFNLGVRQNGERVDNVILPPWARKSARFFTLIQRQALESNYVTQNLHHWIDLIFGYQQSGKAAVEATNVFHPATHFSSDLSKIEDEVKRHAIQTMIKTFGQMPNQLFNMPHPSISADASLPFEDDQLMRVPEAIGLKWGNYVGSPLYAKPGVCFRKKFPSPISRVWVLPTNDVLLLPPNASLLVTYNQQRNVFINTLYIIAYSLCTWSNFDSTIWIKNKEEKLLFTHENQFLDKICICESIPDYDYLLVGYESGLIVAFCLNSTRNSSTAVKIKSRYSLMVGHKSPISSISINKDLSIAVSGDTNGLCILWDMSKLQYVRTLLPESPQWKVKLTCISDTLGDVAIVRYREEGDAVSCSKLTVFTVNGLPVGEVETTPEHITSLCYSTCVEGLAINAIATGLSNGAIKLWSSWDLSLIRNLHLQQVHIPIKSISFSFTNDLLYVVLEDNFMIVLENTSSPFSGQAASLLVNPANRKNFRLLDLTYLNGRSVQ